MYIFLKSDIKEHVTFVRDRLLKRHSFEQIKDGGYPVLRKRILR